MNGIAPYITFGKMVLWSFLILAGTALLQSVHGQDSIDTVHFERKSFAWTPSQSNNSIINGVTLGWSFSPISETYKHTTILNGFNAELSPMCIALGTFTPIMIFFYSFEFGKAGIFMLDLKPSPYPFMEGKKIINGFSLSVGGHYELTEINGLVINGLVTMTDKVEGVQLTGIYNINNYVNGVSIAGFFNRVYQVNGVQIGLFNNCSTGNVVQIGLLNQVGKRVIPFVNMNFKKKSKL